MRPRPADVSVDTVKRIHPLTPRRTTGSVSRRAAVAGLGLTLGATGQSTVAQETTGHPLVGTWVFSWFPEIPTVAPTIHIYTADGAIIDPVFGAGGAWQAIDPQSAAITLLDIDVDDARYTVTRAILEGNPWDTSMLVTYSRTYVDSGGRVQQTEEGVAQATRLPVQGAEAIGTPLSEVPMWYRNPLQPPP